MVDEANPVPYFSAVTLIQDSPGESPSWKSEETPPPGKDASWNDAIDGSFSTRKDEE